MADDPYKTLGVKNDASQEDIQKAYRRRAKKLHPDLNPGDRQAEEQFKEVSSAYDLLSDPEKRARFDRGEIDASGAERPQQRYYRDFGERRAGNPYASNAGFADFADLGDPDDIMSAFFSRSGQTARNRRGSDVRYSLEIDFLDAVNGGSRTVTLPDGSTLDVKIPPGTRDGQVLRLRGKGQPGFGEAPPGDALIEVHVRPHPLFRREGDDIHIELAVSLRDAVLGGKLRVPTPTGAVTMTIPRWSNTGEKLRLKGKGVLRPGGTRGDEYVTVKIVLPENPDPDLERLVAQWQPRERASQAAEA
ncbi:DnaJ C-terminal domain-containing protein [Altererythrobacter sp. Root672]|uniref:DnaJ C-terminal domain-containing protein n=1 Tax=Altererythrobacter sp. Root672 TaxID=1736584 RepID=UPI0006F65FE9|nr:DnaJ C-terminal domain-containing protein [Altererythrobacter sp. Root672]KRA84021.1 molecular chaperone DnaJ [Altererythrobacter sp. Root672]